MTPELIAIFIIAIVFIGIDIYFDHRDRKREEQRRIDRLEERVNKMYNKMC